MLFYNQVKREFTQASWRRGQAYFREERVSNVRLDGTLVAAKVQGSDEAAYETAIVMARGTIFNSDCSCPAHRLYEAHCKHVAALSIWVLERGSLLRAGVGGSDIGVADEEEETDDEFDDQDLVLADTQKSTSDVRLKKLLTTHPVLTKSPFKVRRDRASGLVFGRDTDQRSFSIPITLVEAAALQEHAVREDQARARIEMITAEPVAFVRGVFTNKILSAISVEAALRYKAPNGKETIVDTINHLIRGREVGTFRTTEGLHLKLLHEYVPVIQTVDAAKVIYQGQSALDHLAKLLTHEHRSNIVFHNAISVEYDPRPLRISSMNIGKKEDKSRNVEYEFANASTKFHSSELEELAAQGRLSSQYVWKDGKLYRFEIPLAALSRYSNRSGVSNVETGAKAIFSPHTALKIEDDSQHPLHPIAAYRLSLELGVEEFSVDEDWVEFHEWRKQFDKSRIPPLPKVEYGFSLRDYQTNGLSWLWSLYHRGLGALLADDMGLGKTHQVLAYLSSLYLSRNKPKLPSLVVAPTSVVAAWEQKLQKYNTGLKYRVFHGKGRMLPLKADVQLVLTTYGILQKEAALRSRDWHVVMLDEAQAIKNGATISARAARALKAKFRIAMTGTPVENNATDLWSIMEFLLPGYLGSLPRFKRLYGSGREAPTGSQASALKRLISPFLLRRTKSQVLKELPEKTEEVIACKLSTAQKKVYRSYLNSSEAVKVRTELEGQGKVDYASVLALLTRLKQVCDHPRLPDLSTGRLKGVKTVDPADSGKWEAFEELLVEALGSNLKVVVFTQYLGVIDIISHYLRTKGVGYTELRGDTPDRAERLRKFADDPECKVFVCSLLAGGLGIDLTSASVCIHYDRWWNPAKENQATDRLHRIGQTRGVQVFKLQIPGTIEDRIAQIIENKLSLSDALIEESSLGLKAFSRKELLALLTDPSGGEDEDEDDTSGDSSEGGGSGTGEKKGLIEELQEMDDVEREHLIVSAKLKPVGERKTMRRTRSNL